MPKGARPLTKTNKREEAPDKWHEIVGVLLIAAAVFAGLAIYTGAAGLVGKAISTFFSGFFGMFAYILPEAIAAVGAYIIAAKRHPVNAAKLSMLIVLMVSVLAFTHLFWFDAPP